MARIRRSVGPSLLIKSKQVICPLETALMLVFDVACAAVVLLVNYPVSAVSEVAGVVDDEIVGASVADELVASSA